MNTWSDFTEYNNWFNNISFNAQTLRFRTKSIWTRLIRKSAEPTQVTLEHVCDYKVRSVWPFYRGLIIYVVEPEVSLGDWKRVRKYHTVNTAFFSKEKFRELLDCVEKKALPKRENGVRKHGWYFAKTSKQLNKKQILLPFEKHVPQGIDRQFH